MIGLLDVNVLVALLVPEHQHHVPAQDWLQAEGEHDGWATCPVTELGAIRVCAQLPGGDLPPAVTVDALLLLCVASRGYVFWPEMVSPTVLFEVQAAQTAKQVTDRYLLGLARRYGGRVITFDRGLAQSGGADVVSLRPPV